MQTRLLRNTLSIAVVGLGLMTSAAFGQQASDIDAVKAANQSFYVALSAMDTKAMPALWANKPYVINVGPRSKVALMGYEDAVAKWTVNLPNVFAELNAAMASTTTVQTDGKIAWVIGTEVASGKTKAGEPFTFNTIVTNIFEKDGGKWLMVSHHAQIPPK